MEMSCVPLTPGLQASLERVLCPAYEDERKLDCRPHSVGYGALLQSGTLTG